MTDIIEEVKQEEVPPEVKHALAGIITAGYSMMNTGSDNPWSPSDVDKMDFNVDVADKTPKGDFDKIVDACRFFYRKDPLSSTVINKLVDIGITELEFTKENLSDNEYKIFTSMKDELKEFAESMALEFLLSGLVIPEIKYTAATTDMIKKFGIKKYSSLILPTSMWLRDPKTVKINSTIVNDKPSYFVKIPDDLVYFIMSEGLYKDGTRDRPFYEKLLANYPEFVTDIRNGAKEVLLENDLIFRRRPLTDNPYPSAFLTSAIEVLKHKRNLRRMDYSLAARVISAIQLIQLGNDEYPLTEEDSEKIDSIKNQMYWRNSGGRDIERIFQLFADHTLKITWVMPDVTALLDDTKYKDINQEIIFALGFPRILITGESEKTGTSDAQYATMSPVKTMDNFRGKIIKVIQSIVTEVATQNKLRNIPVVSFKVLQLAEFQTFVTGLTELYNSGNLSRESYADFFGYNWTDEIHEKADENKLMEELKVGEFAPQPFSPQPTQPNGQPPQQNPKPTVKKPAPAKPSGG